MEDNSCPVRWEKRTGAERVCRAWMGGLQHGLNGDERLLGLPGKSILLDTAEPGAFVDEAARREQAMNRQTTESVSCSVWLGVP
jgi:hypothetical protein